MSQPMPKRLYGVVPNLPNQATSSHRLTGVPRFVTYEFCTLFCAGGIPFILSSLVIWPEWAPVMLQEAIQRKPAVLCPSCKNDTSALLVWRI
jgi:hypothetical protein